MKRQSPLAALNAAVENYLMSDEGLELIESFWKDPEFDENDLMPYAALFGMSFDDLRDIVRENHEDFFYNAKDNGHTDGELLG